MRSQAVSAPGPRARFMKWLALGGLCLVLGSLMTGCASLSGKNIKHQVEHEYSVQDPAFLRSMGQLLGPGMLPGNKATVLLNGDQIFPPMLQAIRGAQQSICFETYIYWSGQVGQEFSDALAERARAGVKVHVLLDWFGSSWKVEDRAIKKMREAGVEVARYHPLHWYNFHWLNHRTHRKLLVVDGKIGFTGGVGVGDLWLGNAQAPENWRDSHYQLEGPAVAQMQAAFMDNWLKTQAEVLHGNAYFPALEPAGDQLAQVFKSSPREGSESVRLMYLLSIAAAEKNLRISAAYFVPGPVATKELVDAARRGVKVEIILPGKHSDSKAVYHASRSGWGELLKAGVKLYEYEPTMYHCKVLMVDDVWVSVGSANFDNRSFRLNDEANLNIYSRAFAQEQLKIFEDDKKKCREVTYEEWKNRSLGNQVLEFLFGLLRSQL